MLSTPVMLVSTPRTSPTSPSGKRFIRAKQARNPHTFLLS